MMLQRVLFTQLPVPIQFPYTVGRTLTACSLHLAFLQLMCLGTVPAIRMWISNTSFP